MPGSQFLLFGFMIDRLPSFPVDPAQMIALTIWYGNGLAKVIKVPECHVCSNKLPDQLQLQADQSWQTASA
jgi:hypothetical protein